MKKALFLGFMLLASTARAQVANPSIILVSSAPSGACAVNLPDEQVITLGTIYTCQSGTWAEVSGGSSSGVTSVSGDGTLITNNDSTGAVTLSLGYTPANCTPGTTGSDCLQLTSGLVPAANLPKATTSAFGAVEGDNATTTLTSGVISCTTATTSQIGCVKPDGTTITDAAGVITAAPPVSSGTAAGFFAPTIYMPGSYGATTQASTTTAYCQKFYLPFTRTITHAYMYVAQGETGTADIGLYNLSGTLLISLGGVSVASSTTVTGGTITQGSGSVLLPGGTFYWHCSTSSIATATFASQTNNGGVLSLNNAGSNTNTASFTASVSGGVLPGSMGTLTAISSQNAVLGWYY